MCLSVQHRAWWDWELTCTTYTRIRSYFWISQNSIFMPMLKDTTAPCVTHICFWYVIFSLLFNFFFASSELGYVFVNYRIVLLYMNICNSRVIVHGFWCVSVHLHILFICICLNGLRSFFHWWFSWKIRI